MPINLADYPKDWKVRSRFVRLVRAKGRCEWCGAENYKPHPVTGSRVVLTTAHVFNKDPMAASLLNLAALCQRCHTRHDAMDHVNARYSRRKGADPMQAASLVECIKFCAWRNDLPMKEIARRMGLKPSDLSRKLTQSPDDSRRFTLDDLERFMTVTGDTSPVLYLVEKYLTDNNRIEALEAELARLKRLQKVA